MPRRNRVDPFGELIVAPERGTILGNRGILHDAEGRILRPWKVERWILCRLEFRGRKRAVMSPDRYTELFFLDEATGLAAGHRPCFECRRRSFEAFAGAWARGNGRGHEDGRPRAGSIDERLHGERVGPGRSKRMFSATLDELPDGVFVTWEGAGGTACLIHEGRPLGWSPGGYSETEGAPEGGRVRVLTPPSTVNAIRAGYAPGVHPSASRRPRP